MYGRVQDNGQQYLDHHGRVVVGGVELVELQEGKVGLQVVTW